MSVLVTGAAGFIGYHVSSALLAQGCPVIGVDNLNDYYDVALKRARLNLLQRNRLFDFHLMDIGDRSAMESLFRRIDFRRIIHLAAQPGVRYSLVDPYAYLHSNMIGFGNILEGARHKRVEHLVFSSSSSVYGANTKMPFSVDQNVDHPLSLYAATKKSNELTAHAYASLFGLPCTGLRFFTVYGPWGRPDMAYFLFTKAVFEGKPIRVFNHGQMKRDFTYIDDIVDGVLRVLDKPPEADPNWDKNEPDPSSSFAPYKIYNIGNNKPVELMYFIKLIEKYAGKSVEKTLLPLQAGDVTETFADICDLERNTGFQPKTPVEVGIPKFIEWYREYYTIPL